jgi:hypothetical protein
MYPLFQRTASASWSLTVVVRAIFLICIPTLIQAQGTYPKIEASFTVNTPIVDPFDYSNDVRVLIVQPDTSTVSVPAFFDGGTTWRVRHSPTMAGVYSISNITLNGSPLSYSNLSPGSWTVTGFPASLGFVQVDPTNPRRFITSNGRRYFPVGEDVAWSSPSSGILNIFPKMGAAHENWSRVWMTHFYDNGTTMGLNLDWPLVNNTFGQLSLTNAQHWDAIVAAADQAGIHFQMTLQHHGQYSSIPISNTDPNWEQNPYNTANGGFLSASTNFFTDPEARSLTKRKIRYIVARWGYSPSIMAFELFNEVQYTDAGKLNMWNIIEAWHNEMAQFIRTNDVYHHLITSSSDLTKPIWDQTDYYQHHDYPSDLISGIQGAPDITSSQPVAPDFSGECGINTTPHLGISPPIWAGLMAAQSGGAQPWYWDTIDPNNDYFLIQAAADFVTVSGLADENALTKSSPRTTVPGGTLGSLAFAPGGGFTTATVNTFTVGNAAPTGIGSAPAYIGPFLTSNYVFLVTYPTNGTFTVFVSQSSPCGGALAVIVDGAVKTNASFAGNGTCGGANTPVSVNRNYTVSVSSGSHTIQIFDPGPDWIKLGTITLAPYVPRLGAYAVGTNNWQAIWMWDRTNVFLTTPISTVTGTVDVVGLDPGTYSGTWWDTFGAGAVSNFSFTVTSSSVPVTLGAPPFVRSMALYVGIPAQAGIVAPNLNQTAASNAPSFNVPLVLTNSGGLPLAYSLSSTSAVPAWLSFSSTNGYVSKSSALTVYLAFNPAGLAPGTYTFTLFVNTSDPLLPLTALPISFTVSSGLPAAPQLQVLSGAGGQFVVQLSGDTNVAYVLQNSPDLVNWIAVSTNTLPGGTLIITNPIVPGPSQQFWRALWQP